MSVKNELASNDMTQPKIEYNIKIGKKMSKEEKLKVFGCNLKRLRENASMTKSAVAAYLEIIPQQYYRYEDGTSEPGVILATKLASLYGVDVHDLFDGFNDIQERNLKIIRQLSDYGISAMASTDGEIFVDIFEPQGFVLTTDIMEDLLQKTKEDIKPATDNNFKNALLKNFFQYTSKQ